MKSADIRDAFLRFFANNGHEVVASSSLVPGNDPTLLFTNAGMVQFKDVFLGVDKRPYSRATSSQRCVRAGGKHNDLENVGYTARHHTFFEMLGNFSFGDYFKREAIQFAWRFLTEELKLPAERLWVTVHISDDEAADIWINEMGVSPERFSRLDEDNFWQMGDTGPCGPSSEIFYDHGEDVPGGPPGSENDDLDRYIEIWNLVFMQYERQADGELIALPKPSVDTGMGLERMAAVMQGVHSNYEIDLFQALLKAAAELCHCDNLEDKSLRVIADHIRSCAFLAVDGVLPSNEGRGYVLRRIIRRAIRHGHKLGQTDRFFYKLVGALVEQMGAAYPELTEQRSRIEKVLLKEEEQFAQTLDKGMDVLETKLATLEGKEIPGDIIFTLYDTYGFPVDLTNDIARERGLSMDMAGYEAHMAQQRQQSRESGKFRLDYTAGIDFPGQTQFSGYEELQQSSSVVSMADQDNIVEQLQEGQEGIIVLAATPFYAESGGQAGDTGYIDGPNGRFEVRDCQKVGSNHLHVGEVIRGHVQTGDTVTACVEHGLRHATALNHSATHLLHAALRKVLGEHVSQKGSLVDSNRLRFDFSHFEPITEAQLAEIEGLVNHEIARNTPVTTQICTMEEAKAAGALALFGEKYGDTVRVLTMGDGFSVELCGGTHVGRSGDICLFKITSETGVAAGVRRIEAITGATALGFLNNALNILHSAADALKVAPESVADRIAQLHTEHKQLEKTLSELKTQLASGQVDQWLDEAQQIQGVKVLLKLVDSSNDVKVLRGMMDKLKDKLGTAAVLLAGTDGEFVKIVAGVSKDALDRFKAGDLVRQFAGKIGAKGGGRPDMAQGGGEDNGQLPQALAELAEDLKGVQ